jgi:hypothetical protein
MSPTSKKKTLTLLATSIALHLSPSPLSITNLQATEQPLILHRNQICNLTHKNPALLQPEGLLFIMNKLEYVMIYFMRIVILFEVLGLT